MQGDFGRDSRRVPGVPVHGDGARRVALHDARDDASRPLRKGRFGDQDHEGEELHSCGLRATRLLFPQTSKLALDVIERHAHRRLHLRPSRSISSNAASGPHVPAA
jgi:hypothetical protein